MAGLAGRLRLIYLPVRARAESLRMMLAYGKVPYEDVVLSLDEFGKQQAQGHFPFSQLPVLHAIPRDSSKQVFTLSQSGAIARYLAPYTNLEPQGGLQEAATCDSYFEAAQDMSLANPIVNVFVGENLERFSKVFLERLPTRLKDTERIVSASSERCGGEAFLMGRLPTYADMNMVHYLQQVDIIASEALDAHACLRAYIRRVECLPGVNEYLKGRPPLSQLGKALLPDKGHGEANAILARRLAGV